MAKRDDDELPADEVAEDVMNADEFDDVEDADAELYDDEEPYEEEKPRLKPRVTGLTLTLIFLNVLAAAGFVFVLMLDYHKRQGFTYSAVANEAVLMGVGTTEDTKGDTAAQAAALRPKLSNESLKEAFRGRGGTTSVSEPFTPVEDGLKYQLYVGELHPDIVRDTFKDIGDPVKSIEEEMKRLESAVPARIKEVVEEWKTASQKATDADKRRRVELLLYPLCVTPKQVENVETRIKGAQGAALDALLAEAVERRILSDILMPVELFRASDPNLSTAKAPDVAKDGQPLYPQGVLSFRAAIEGAAGTDGITVADLQKLLTDRLASAVSDKHDGKVYFGGDEWTGKGRWTIEKRQNAAFLLVAVAHARKHLNNKAKIEDQLVFPKGLERAQRLSGLYDFTAACKAYIEVAGRLEARVLDAIALDRDGFDIQVKGAIQRSESFADKHVALQVRIRGVQLQIRQAEERLKELQQQRDKVATLVKERETHRANVETRIKQERDETRKRIDELREMQKQLHRALVELAGAAEENARLEARLRELSGAKGGEQ